MLFQQVINLFHYKKNNKTREKPIEKEKALSSILTSKTTSFDNSDKLPQVEFEQSRFLLEMDFFHEPTEQEDPIMTSFLQFDHLLSPAEQEEEQQQQKTLSKRLSTTLRHRISIYKPQSRKHMNK